MKMNAMALLVRASALAMAGALIFPGGAQAQTAPGEARVNVDIPAGSLGPALEQFGRQAGVALVYPAEMAQGLSTRGVSGTMTIQEALARLLAGTGLASELSGGVVNIRRIPVGDNGERVLGAVRVQGAQGGASALPGSTPVNGINGSRDVTATEGTGSYTSNALTVGSKTAASIKDTPMSVSVLTSQQLQDQHITDLNGAMRNLPGVTVIQGASADELDFYSRGFQITQIQFDGGAALNTNPANVGYSPIIDLSLYDHIELVRGASGTFNAYGSPGGVINLVRKKPLDHQQFQFDMQIGSWDWHRISVDLTGPLGFGGKLRGRVIATHQDNNFFYDTAKSNRNVLSGTLEYDLTTTTLVSVGVNYQDGHDLPFSWGLMRYENGEPLGLPRSTCFCFDYAKANTTNTELFGQIEQRFGSKWTFKIRGTRIKQKGVSVRPHVSGTVNPYTLAGASADPSSYYYLNDRQTLVEATLDGSFRLFGRDQKVVVGANYSTENPTGTARGALYDVFTGDYPPFAGRTDASVDVFHFNPRQWNEPNYPAGYYSKTMPGSYWRTINSYINLDLEPIKRLHVAIGLRFSQTHQSYTAQNVCGRWNINGAPTNSPCYGKQPGDLVFKRTGNLHTGNGISWPPSIQWRYDLTKNLTVSAIYTDIYIDQSQTLDKDGNPLPPIRGGNFEGELKWASPSRKLNVTLSAYYTKQNGFTANDPICLSATPDPKCTSTNSTSTPGQFNLSTNCCYIFDPSQANISYGADIEVQGEIRKGWQISASYNFNYNYVKNSKLFDGRQQPLTAFAPRHRAQLWTSYNFNEDSRFKGLFLAFGAQAQSKTFVVDGYCSAYVPDPTSPLPGAKRCADNGFVRVAFTDPGRVVLSGSIGYKVNDTLRLDLQMENLLDKNYFESVGGISNGGFYGSPRSFKLSLHGKW